MLGEERLPPDFPAAALVTPRAVSFRSEDGVLVHGQLFESAGAAAKKPAVVYVHGGPPRQMLLGWHYSDYYSNAYALNQYLASRGFVVLSVNYRLGIGFGYDFHRPRRAGAQGASEYLDVKAAGLYLRTPATGGSSARRDLRRLLRRLPDGARARARLGPVRGGSRRPRRPRLDVRLVPAVGAELGLGEVRAERPRGGARGRVALVAGLQRRRLALARSADPCRRRPQRPLHRDGRPGAAARRPGVCRTRRWWSSTTRTTS